MITLLLMLLALLAVFGLSIGLLYLSLRYIGKAEIKIWPLLWIGLLIGLVGALRGGALLAIPVGLYLIHKFYKISWGSSSKVYFAYAITAVIIQIAGNLFIYNFVGQAYHEIGVSMSPTINEQDYMLVSRTEFAFGGSSYVPKRGSIVVFHFPLDPSRVLIKRVVGLPGDHLVITNGSVTVSNSQNPKGFNPDSSYEPKGTTTLINTDETVQLGNVFVMGDNRSDGGSYDSRQWGQLPLSYVIGIAKYNLLPLQNAKSL